MINTKCIAVLLNSSSIFVLGTVMLSAGAAHAFDGNALPQGGIVTGGAATLSRSGNTLTVNQTSNRAIIDWRNFDIGANAQANFNQPGASSIAVNRVNGSTDPSRIDGGLRANGQVWILNPNGVFFGKTARVDAAGVVASTANIDDKAFMSGSNRLQMRGGSSGSVVNEGQITVGQGGLAAFVAPSVRNSGTIRATVGKVALAAGETYTLDLASDRLVELGLGSNAAVVDNSGQIVNAGGVVTISAKAASQVVDGVINMSGIVDASSVSARGGEIVLGADNINVASSASFKVDGASGGQVIAVAGKTGNYAGSYSAKGSEGDGGHIETSGAKVRIASDIAVDTRSSSGKTGNWTIDPDDLTVTEGPNGGPIDPDASSITNGTIVNQLATTGVTLTANNSITVDAAIDSTGQSNSSVLALSDQDGGGLTINLNASITLGAHQSLRGQGTTVNVGAGGLIQNGIDAALAGGATVNVAAGTFAPNVNINKSGLSLLGAPGATINVNPGSSQVNGINIAGSTDHVTVSGFDIRGEITGSYLDYAFGSGTSRGVAVANGATNFTISGNTIRNVRNGVLVDGRNTGSVTDNVIDNTKSAISIQYSNGNAFGHDISVSGNSQEAAGNEWGLIYHLNQHLVDANTVQGNVSGTASDGVQASLLAARAANNGLSVMDRAYTVSNRTDVVVNANASPSNVDGSPLSPVKTINAGVAAVVSGGTVSVKDGTYAIASGGANYININKSLHLVGQSEAGVIVDARNASTYGLRVTASDGPVSIEDLTLYGVTATNGYGLKAEATKGLTLSSITSRGAAKSEFDLNSVVGGTLDHLTANGASVVSGTPTEGNGISLTDSQNITLTNVTTANNNWGGLALYQSNNATGSSLQLNNITVNGTNSFSEANGIYAQVQSATNDIGNIDLSGQAITHVAKAEIGGSEGSYTWFRKSGQAAIDAAADAPVAATVQGYSGNGVTGDNHFLVGTSGGGTALSVNAALARSTTGGSIDVQSGTYAEDVAMLAPRTVNFGDVTLGSLSLQAGGAGSTLSGTISAGSVSLDGAINLGGNLALNAAGTISLASVDGAHDLSVSGSDVSLGDVGSTTRLGAVTVVGDTTLTGDRYKAGSFTFNSDVNLTQATTVIDTTVSDTVAGGITVAGDIFGQTDGGQSLTLSAGSGTGAKLTNGDITLRNAGLSGVRLGGLSVSGDDFFALTVDLAGDFISQLAGNQIFAADTLNAGGSVNTSAVGDVAGHIVAAGDVALNAGGTLSGEISGNALALTANDINNATLSGTSVDAISAGQFDAAVSAVNGATVLANNITGTISGGSVNLTGQTVNSQVTATNNATVQATSIGGAISGTNVSLTGQTVNSQVAATNNATVQATNIGGAISGTNVSLTGQTVNSQITATNSATVQADSIAGSFSGNNVSLTGQTVSGQVTANVLNVDAAQGSISGAWQQQNASGGLVLNGETVPPGGTADPLTGLNPRQLVVENFTLPQGTLIGANGELILPAGIMISLLSPSGTGQPRVVSVNSVRTLGELLAAGYTAIVIDLNNRKDEMVETASVN